jgi:O-antigen ligase
MRCSWAPTRYLPGAAGAGRLCDAVLVWGANRVNERALALVGLLLLGVRGFVYRIRLELGGVSGSLLDDAVVNIAFYSLYGAVIVCFVFRMGRPTPRKVAAPLATFCGVVMLSTLWSIEWSRTLNQSVLLASGTLAVAVVASQLSVRGMMVAVASATQVVLVVSLIAVVRGWEFSVDRRGYWAGMLFNRNALGLVAAVALLASVGWAWLHRDRPRALVMPSLGLVFAAAMWAKTASATPMIAVIAALAAGGAVVVVRRSVAPRRAMVALGVGSVALIGCAVAWRAEVSRWIGRDATFTGRTSTWDLVVDSWLERPFAGFGFFAGWFDSDLRAGLREIGFNHWEAHNGFLEVLLGAGVIGAGALLWFLAVVCGLVWRARGRDEAPWFAAVVAFFIVVNIGETAIAANRLAWMLLVAVAVRMASPSSTDSTD